MTQTLAKIPLTCPQKSSSIDAGDAEAAGRGDSLLALVVGLGGVLEETGVLDGDRVALLGDGPGALLGDGLGDTHDDSCAAEGSCD